MKRYSFFFFFIIAACFSSAQTLQTYATIESIGYEVSNLGSFSTHLSVSSRFRVQSGTWRNGYAPNVTAVSGNTIIAGSFFELTPATNYEVEITIVDSVPGIHSSVVSGFVTTMAEPSPDVSYDTLWVSPVGTGTLYTHSNPGKFDQLFQSDYSKIKCGTIISCRGGTYYTGDLQYFTQSATCGNDLSVAIMSAPGEHAVFDGSDTSAAAMYPTWTVYNAGASIYKATLPVADAFSALFLIDTLRLFPYATIDPANIPGQYNECLSNCMSYFGPGFYRNENVFYVKLAGGVSPVGKKVTVSQRTRLLWIYNNSNSPMHFTFRNLEMRNYGKAVITKDAFGNITADGGANTLWFWKMKRTLIDSCVFNYNTYSLNFNYNFDTTIIQNCTFKDQTGLWSHGAYKNTSLGGHGDLNLLNDPGKFGRTLETSTIWFDGLNNSSTCVILRKNKFNGLVAASGGRSDTAGYANIVHGSDFYDNVYENNYNICTPPGNNINFRFFRNRVSRFLVGISLIDNAIGGVYLFRNVFEQILSRDNHANNPSAFNPTIYVNYGGCLGVRNKVWGTIFKANAGVLIPKRYNLHLLHNTVHSTDSLGYNFFLWDQNWKSITSLNNSFNAVYCIANFEKADSNTYFSFNSVNDNYYAPGAYIGTTVGEHGNLSTCHNAGDLPTLLSDFQTLSFNHDTTLLNFRGYNVDPGFISASGHNFYLNSTSGMIDKGLVINNISDLPLINYYGMAPDIGAFESNFSTTQVKQKEISSGLTVFPNPTNGNIIVCVTEKYKGARLIVRNVLGEIVVETILKEERIPLQIDDRSGVYLLEVTSANERPMNIKIVKE